MLAAIWTFFLSTVIPVLFFALGLRCLVLAYYLLTYRPTHADEERWARRAHDRRMIRLFLCGEMR